MHSNLKLTPTLRVDWEGLICTTGASSEGNITCILTMTSLSVRPRPSSYSTCGQRCVHKTAGDGGWRKECQKEAPRRHGRTQTEAMCSGQTCAQAQLAGFSLCQTMPGAAAPQAASHQMRCDAATLRDGATALSTRTQANIPCTHSVHLWVPGWLVLRRALRWPACTALAWCAAAAECLHPCDLACVRGRVPHLCRRARRPVG